MSEQLSVELIDEATLALTSVVRLTLPDDRWEAVGQSVRLMDDAVWADDGRVVRAQLRNLRGAVIGTAPRPRPGEDAKPTVNPLSYRTTDYATRTPVRTISLLLIGAAVLLATLVALIMVVLAVGPERESGGPAPTTTSAPTEPLSTDSGSSGGIYLVGVALLVILGIAGFAVMIGRRRAQARAPRPEVDEPSLPLGNREPPPPEVVEAVDRVVAVLAARRESS